jgi:pyruvate formate lyase activating enzyme
MRNIAPTPRATLTHARRIALRNGLHHVYTGNVFDPDGSSTYCPHCREVLIERVGYELGAWNLALDEGNTSCRFCGTPIAGVFEAAPGTWGSRRQPVSIAA